MPGKPVFSDLPKTNSSNINLISCFNFVSGPGAVLVPAPNLVPNPEADPVLDPNLGADLNQLIVMAIQKRTAIATDPRADQDPVLEQNQNLVLGPDLEMTKKIMNFSKDTREENKKRVSHYDEKLQFYISYFFSLMLLYSSCFFTQETINIQNFFLTYPKYSRNKKTFRSKKLEFYFFSFSIFL